MFPVLCVMSAGAFFGVRCFVACDADGDRTQEISVSSAARSRRAVLMWHSIPDLGWSPLHRLRIVRFPAILEHMTGVSSIDVYSGQQTKLKGTGSMHSEA